MPFSQRAATVLKGASSDTVHFFSYCEQQYNAKVIRPHCDCSRPRAREIMPALSLENLGGLIHVSLAVFGS